MAVIERTELETQICDAVADVPGIAALLLFGSRGRGTARPTSDLDLAVLPTAEEAVAKRRAFQTLEMRVHVAVGHLSPHREQHVDVVRLDRAPETLRQRVMLEGRMLLCRDPAAWRALRVKTMREVGDRQWMRAVYRRGLRRRLLEGRPVVDQHALTGRLSALAGYCDRLEGFRQRADVEARSVPA